LTFRPDVADIFVSGFELAQKVAAKTNVCGVMQMTHCDACASAAISVTTFAEKVTW